MPYTWDKEGRSINPAQEDGNLENIKNGINTLAGTGAIIRHAIIVLPAGGPTEIITSPGTGHHIEILGLFGTAGTNTGSIKFSDGRPTDLTGVMDVVVGGGFVILAQNASIPVLQCATNTSFTGTTVTSTFNGAVVYVIKED